MTFFLTERYIWTPCFLFFIYIRDNSKNQLCMFSSLYYKEILNL